jgi:hypothetical protein
MAPDQISKLSGVTYQSLYKHLSDSLIQTLEFCIISTLFCHSAKAASYELNTKSKLSLKSDLTHYNELITFLQFNNPN